MKQKTIDAYGHTVTCSTCGVDASIHPMFPLKAGGWMCDECVRIHADRNYARSLKAQRQHEADWLRALPVESKVTH